MDVATTITKGINTAIITSSNTIKRMIWSITLTIIVSYHKCIRLLRFDKIKVG